MEAASFFLNPFRVWNSERVEKRYSGQKDKAPDKLHAEHVPAMNKYRRLNQHNAEDSRDNQ